MLPRFRADQLVKFTPEYAFWGRSMERIYHFTRLRGRSIAWIAAGLMAVCLLGISKINTNYRLKSNLPRGQQITTDFLYFEDKFSGFRPVEFAVFPQNGRQADDFAVLREMDKFENHLRSYAPIKTLVSINDVYRSLNAMNYGNRPEGYRLPDSLAAFQTTLAASRLLRIRCSMAFCRVATSATRRCSASESASGGFWKISQESLSSR